MKENAYATLLFCGIRNTHVWSNITPSLKKIYQISPWNKNLVSSHTYIYKGKIMNSSDLSIIFSLLVLLLFWYVNILYRKINLQVYILNLLFLKHQNKKNQHELCIFISYQYLFPYLFGRRRVCGGLLIWLFYNYL